MDRRWQYPLFRQVNRTMTAVWGIGYVAEAAVRVVIAYSLAPAVTLVVSPLLATVVTAALIVFTMRYARWAQRRGQALQARREAATGNSGEL